MGPYLVAIPYSDTGNPSGPYVWAQQGQNDYFTQPVNAPGGRVGAIVAQFLMVGDVLQQQTQVIATGDGSTLNFTGGISNLPMLATGNVYDQNGTLSGQFQNGLIPGSGYLQQQNLPGTIEAMADYYNNSAWSYSVFQIASAASLGQNAFTTLTINGVTKSSASASYSYQGGASTWIWSSGGPFFMGNGVTYPATFTGSTWSTTIVAGGALQGSTGIAYGYVLGQCGTIVTAGLSTVNYETGNVNLVCNLPPPAGDQIYAVYTQAAPYRVAWSAIGDPTNWPIPLTANAVAFQSGYEDLEADLGAVKFIGGYPLYGVIFQEFGITRANYVGGNVVFSFAVISRNRGAITRGGNVVVGGLVYFLSQDGFFVTDGNSVTPIGTDAQNQLGIDNWFWSNVNTSALETIRAAYDSQTRCVYFAIPTGSNTLPDTLLTYNPIATKWTRSQIPTELLFTNTNGSATPGTLLQLGIFDQTHQLNTLTGPTLSGYLETCDVMDVDGNQRFTLGIRPNVASTDTPQAQAGVRNALTDNVTYTVSSPPDTFSRIVPTLVEGLYTRARVSSSAAQAFIGATIYQEPGGSV